MIAFAAHIDIAANDQIGGVIDLYIPVLNFRIIGYGFSVAAEKLVSVYPRVV